ncbi:MAG: hypothetical protein KME28_22090 [Pelatocladus maniniholoensis HA4357-MV3]|jgi:ElaB/YqjD/DUF883 family membrane-anchored ribosome-binding protein|uniref:P-type conjugative transfer protein TrbJ n=1 Tax=Pelatocladus maniniholoensis HA4357-MV3 TaxID=1117104 RepID=A0A9E3HB14_9NOST|nr:hypothetical protein [Pelatocladus maniniholoensis HA4357-MV3]
MSKLKRRIVRTLVGACAISTIGMNSAHALDLLGVFDQLQYELNDWNNYVSSILSEQLEPLVKSLGEDLQIAIDEAIGELGLPDPTQTRKKTEEIVANSNTSINKVERATNEIDRQITRAVVNGTFSKEGQQRTKQQIEKTQTSIQQVQQQAQEAQQEVVTQNIMKKIAIQNAQIGEILGAMRADGLRMQQSQDLTNVNLTNISRSLDGQNQVHQREVVDQGYNNLKITAQARLF